MGDIRHIRVLWPDHLGLARGKYLPVRLAERGTRHSITLFSLGYDRDMVPAPGSMLLDGMPDMECRFDPGSMVSESIDHQVGASRRADRLVDWFLD